MLYSVHFHLALFTTTSVVTFPGSVNSAPFCPCHSLFSHSSRHLHNTAAVSLLHTSDQCSWAVLSSAAVDDKNVPKRKKKLLVKVRCSLATFAKCDHLHCLCSSSTELDNSLNDNCQRCCVHTLSFDKERGRQKWTISNFKAKFRKDASSSSSYLLIGQRCKMRLVQLLKLWLLYVANYQLHLTLPRWLLGLLLFRWLLLVVDLEKWKRKW